MEDLTNSEIIIIKQGNTEFLQFKRLLQYKNIKHAYGIKPKNYRTMGVNENVVKSAIQNYIDLCYIIESNPNNIIKPEQMHTNNVDIAECVTKMDIEQIFKSTDGLITNNKNIILATTNADCVILLIYDPIKNVIANVHSGWKGTVQRIAEVTINKMIEQYNCNPKDIICCICPSIRKCHFEVETPVKEIFEVNFKNTGRIAEIIEYNGKKANNTGNMVDKWLIDTVLINKIMLKNCGLLEENIIDSGICSVCNSNKVHSCRVEGKENYGLNTAIIEMV